MRHPPVPDPPIALAGGYRTHPARRPILSARICPVSLAFYRIMMQEVFAASHRAKRGRYDDAEWIRSSWNILCCLEAVGCRFEITGMRGYAGTEGPVVFISNHMSTLETFVLPVLIHPVKRCTFIVKSSLITYPVFGHIMRSRNPIAVGRDNPRQDLVTVLDEGRKRLEAGVSLILFPQTTRIERFDPATFNSLGVKLARNAGVPVVPVALATSAWGNGKRLKDFGRIDPSRPVHIAFGEPKHVFGTGKGDHDRVVEFISGKVEEWNRQDEE